MSAAILPHDWKRLCGKAVSLCGGQAPFRSQARILKRLVAQFGSEETEHMIDGAQQLGWRDLKSLGSAQGLGRRWALEKYWQSVNSAAARPRERLEGIAQVLKARGLV